MKTLLKQRNTINQSYAQIIQLQANSIKLYETCINMHIDIDKAGLSVTFQSYIPVSGIIYVTRAH